MDPKEFTLREQLDYSYRLPLYRTMELYIETLTGTCFELRVSPYETVISVKAKIQRLEGIPIGQQYLIWQNVELEDDYCLHDYNITDGCTLKLVLAMRGGPINTRRIAMEEPDLREMAEFVESNRAELFDKPSPPPSGGNNKQVTLLVYRDGDQLNFFRVVDRGDGTLTPFSESLSESVCNLREVEEEDDSSQCESHVIKSPGQQPLSVAQEVENNVTASKMKQLRSHMRHLRVSPVHDVIKQSSSLAASTPLVHATSEKPLNLTSVDKPYKHEARMPTKPMGSSQTAAELTETRLSARCHSSSKVEAIASLEPELDKQAVDVSIEEGATAKTEGNKPAVRLSAGQQFVSRSDFRRAQLKRMKDVNSSQDFSTKVTAPQDDGKVKEIKESKEESTVTDSTNITPKAEEDKPVKKTENGDRFSPRTRRLLNALESSTTQKKPSDSSTTAYRSPRSTNLLQGMTFNRHDLYLRSYGLIASPDDGTEERALSSSSGEIIPVKPEEPPVASKMYETSQGVKYSSLVGSHANYWSAGERLLKSPPVWGASKDLVVHPGSVRLGLEGKNPTHYSRDKSTTDELRLKTSPQSSSYLSRSLHQNLEPEIASKATNNKTTLSESLKPISKEDAFHLPQPPPTGLSAKQKLRRLNTFKPLADGTKAQDRLEGSKLSKDPYLPARHPFRQNSSKSGLRVTETNRGKVESMSRQEAREVVNFINKTLDASILRNLVRSPNKDSQRGNSGQTSHRHGVSNLRTNEGNRNLLRSSLGSHRSTNRHPSTSSTTPRPPQILPPVKPPSKKKRCFLCAKRTGLATSYVCRCGNNFCATHRYAETHNCTYDYKSTGRKLLEEANPLVSAPKLPKI